MKVSSTKQSAHKAKSYGLSLQFIQMELSGFNAEPEWNDSVFGEYNHLQMIFYKLNKNTSGLVGPVGKFPAIFSPCAHKIEQQK